MNKNIKIITFSILSLFSEKVFSQDTKISVSAVKTRSGLVSGISSADARLESQNQNAKVYLYNFNRKIPGRGELAQYGAFHTAEVPYAWRNLNFLVSRPLEKSDQDLSKLMSDYWINFIKSGDPNAKGLSTCPKYNTKYNLAKVFDKTTTTTVVPGKSGLDCMLSRNLN